jgi:hypothetical protein
MAADFWEQLEKKYRIVFEGNKATASERRRVLGDKPVLTARAILGTKAVEVEMNPQNGVPGFVDDVYAEQDFTELNLTSELRKMCLFLLAQWELAQTTVKAGLGWLSA